MLQVSQVAGFARFIFEQARSRAALALGFLLLGSFAEGSSILLLVPVLHLVEREGGTFTIGVPIESLRGLVGPSLQLGLLSVLALLVLLVFAQAVFMRIKSVYMAELLYELVNRLRLSLFESIGRARWQFISGTRGSQLNHALTADIDRVQSAAFQSLLLVQACVLLLAYLGVSLLISPAMTGVAFLSGGLVLGVLHPIRQRASTYGAKLTENRQEQYKIVSEFLGGLKLAKSLNAEHRFFAEMSLTLWRMRADFVRFVRLSSISGMLFQVSSAVVLSGFVYIALQWYALPLAKIVVLVFLFLRIAPRFTVVQSSAQQILVDMPAFYAMREVQAACERERDVETSTFPATPSLQRELRFHRIGFSYSGTAEDVLGQVSFRVPAHQITALIGPSGSGKSTIADLLVGLLEPTTGRITVDAAVLDSANRRAWRDCVAYVPQEAFLLHDTISTNLALAKPDASDSAMWEALHAANAAEFVEQLPDQLRTVVGDRGLRLSGGERQRIALARAILRRPQLLVLDEATSALDWENQSLIARSIAMLRGRTTIVTIAHRPSMIVFADWVVALDKGKIVETGPYQQLAGTADSRLSQMLAGENSPASNSS